MSAKSHQETFLKRLNLLQTIEIRIMGFGNKIVGFKSWLCHSLAWSLGKII
jgi:hypothetical protein